MRASGSFVVVVEVVVVVVVIVVVFGLVVVVVVVEVVVFVFVSFGHLFATGITFLTMIDFDIATNPDTSNPKWFKIL